MLKSTKDEAGTKIKQKESEIQRLASEVQKANESTRTSEADLKKAKEELELGERKICQLQTMREKEKAADEEKISGTLST